MVLGDTAKKSLFQKLQTLSEEDVSELGREIDRCYRAKTATEESDETAIIFGDLHSSLTGGRSSKEVVVMDSGCTRDIISMDIVKDLGLKMMELQKPLNIVSADGSILNIVGTTSFYFSSQATNKKKKNDPCRGAGGREGP